MKKHIVLSFMLSLLLAGGLYSQATLSMQGTIRNSTGSAVPDGTYSLTFKLYTVESGGTAVWSETQDDIRVAGGVYSALLGAATPLNAAFNVPYYVGVAVDGGAELVPRFRLTSAPYALSLIGQSNTFPSSGTVGVGTASPDPNTQLTVSGGSGDAKMLLTAPGDKDAVLWLRSGNNLSGMTLSKEGHVSINSPGAASRVHLYSGTTLRAHTDETGFVVAGRLLASGTLWTQNGDISSANNQDLRLYRDGDLHILGRGDGWTEFKKPLYLPNGRDAYLSGVSRFYHGWFNQYGAFLSDIDRVYGDISLLSDGGIVSEGFFIKSDARVKKDLALSDGASDLATLMRLKVTDYRQVDFLAHGNDLQKGFIAQQVDSVYPQAVHASRGKLPDIYDLPSGYQINGEEATFTMGKPHALAVGDRVNIVTEGESGEEYEVVNVKDNHSFTVKDWKGQSPSEKTFVFGKVVNDFRRVDYDKIHTLNVSATQELARRVAQLEAENAALRQKSGDAEGLRSELNDLKARFSKLESLLNANANR